MGIHLDWQVESDLGNQAVEEDAQVIVAQKKRRRRWLIALLATLVVIGAAGSIAWYRAKIIRDEKLRVLLATVDAEAEALRLGDEDKFMKLQGPDEKWRDEQRDMFDQMQAFGVSIDVTGRILSQHITDREAEITIEIRIGGMPTQAVWLYQYTEKGWKHVDTQQEPWQDTTVERYPFTYEYNTAHQPLIDQLDAMLREWWATSETELGLDAPMEMRIVIDPEISFVRWNINDRTTLIIPQKMLVSGDLTAPDDRLRIELAKRISARWVIHFVNEHDFRDYSFDYQTEVALWLQDHYGVNPDDSYRQSIFTQLEGYLGEDVFQQFMTEWKETHDGKAAIERLMFSDLPPNTADGLPSEAYLVEFLNAYTALNDNRNMSSMMGMMQERFITYGDDPSNSIFLGGFYLSGAQAGTIQIEEMEMFQEVLWVRATFQYDVSHWQPDSPPAFMDRASLIPFRKDGDIWKLTALNPADWGPLLTEQTEYITFHYPEIDQDLYQDLAPYLESVYVQAAQELGLTDIVPIEINVRTDFMYYGEAEENVIDPILYPHRLQCCFGEYDMTEESIRITSAQTVYNEVLSFVTGLDQNVRLPFTLLSALTEWSNIQHGWVLDYGYPDTVPMIYPEVPVPTTFEDLWVTNQTLQTGEDEYAYMLRNMGAEELINLLMDTYGDEAFLPLVQNIRLSDSIDTWLQLSLALDEREIRDLEDAWRERYHAAVRERLGDEPFSNQ